MTRRILVIEDEHVMRELLRLHLGSAGYSVEVAEDAIAAGYALLKGPPDLIISDVEMPHMSGLELLAALRAEENLARVPVIFLTSFEEGEDRARSLGALEYLPKPIRLDELLAAVQRHLPAAS
jgi:two-component system, cell cycle response regulator DivK